VYYTIYIFQNSSVLINNFFLLNFFLFLNLFVIYIFLNRIQNAKSFLDATDLKEKPCLLFLHGIKNTNFKTLHVCTLGRCPKFTLHDIFELTTPFRTP